MTEKKNDNKNNRLGRGLSSLLGDSDEIVKNIENTQISTNNPLKSNIKKIPIEFINPTSWQPRKHFDQESLKELSLSIREKGIFQPILVRSVKNNNSRYEIIAGERRWRAAQLAKLHDVPCIILDIDDKEASEISIIENIQRQDLSSVEEAEGYTTLIKEHNYTHEELSEIIGKSRSHISNMIRLLLLPKNIIDRLLKKELTMGQVRPLIGHPSAEKLGEEIFIKNISAREVEKLIKNLGKENLK